MRRTLLACGEIFPRKASADLSGSNIGRPGVAEPCLRKEILRFAGTIGIGCQVSFGPTSPK